MFSLNPSIYDHVDVYKELWNTQGIITITNLLPIDQANFLNNYLLNLSEDKWCFSIHPYIPHQYTFTNTPENKDHIINGIKSANHCFNNGGFSYCFRRYDNFPNDGVKFNEFITSSSVLDLINNITGLNVKSSVSLFASCYSGDSFLSTHTDQGRGSIALVFNLTKDWDDNNGGCFELLDNDWHTIKKRVSPKFNSLTIFKVPENGIPHRVTRVNSTVTAKRIAFSGWFV